MTEHTGQEALVESAHVKFHGMSMNALDTPPEIDDRMTFLVTAVCTGYGFERRKDGELRKTMKMDVAEVVKQGSIVKPERDPELPYDDAADDD